MRENKQTPAHLHPVDYYNDRANKSMRSRVPLTKRLRTPGEALPLASSVWTKDSYHTGDGEVRQLQRPGSEHAYTLPSRGYRT